MKLFRVKITKLTLFGLACASVALGYIGYRGVAVLGPNGFGSFVKGESVVKTIGCAEGDEAAQTVSNAERSVPASYQKFLAAQASTGKNLIANSAIEEIHPDTKTPRAYARTVENSTLAYQVRNDNNGLAYLHVEQDTAQNIGGAWVAEAVPLQPDVTYAYGFSYRSDTAALVTAEFVSAAGEHTYQSVAKLDKGTEWQNFTYYFHNAAGAAGFRFVVSPVAIGALDTKNYTVHQVADARLPEGMVSVTFDDGWQSVADKALPLLNRYGLKTTQYIIADAPREQVPGYMNYATIATFKHRGDEIGSHSLTHCNQAHLPDAEVRANSEESKQQLQNQRFGPIESFAYPYGSYDDKTQAIISESYPLIRTSDEGYNDRYFDPQNIRSFAITNHTSDKDFQAWLDYAKSHQVWLVLVYHRVDETGEYSVSSGNLDRQLRMIRDSQLQVLPLAQAAHTIRK